jgi:cytochrome c oxidase assembly protein subunit 15
VLVVVVAQGAIGYLQYATGIPAALVLAHIIGATAVLSTMIWFHLGLSAPKSGPRATAIDHTEAEAAAPTGAGSPR